MIKKLSLFAAALGFLLGCTEVPGDLFEEKYGVKYDYCVISGSDQKCLAGPFTSNICNGYLSNDCPAGYEMSPYSSSSGNPSLCNGEEYNPSTHYCPNDVLKKFGSVKDLASQEYKTVVIGTQTWMAENLNYNAGYNVGNSRCYNGKPANCEIYGKMYDWATAMAFLPSCNVSDCSEHIQPVHRGICPVGWHIPTQAEWNVLFDFVGGTSVAGKHLKSKSGWNGEDTYGFGALPGGWADLLGAYYRQYISVGSSGYWWSSTSDRFFNYGMTNDAESVSSNGSGAGKNNLQSVRCVHDVDL
jgi:uncharacterized protein (TIGR02145 family)